MHGGFPILPVVVFCIVFGLSMDYEVFIVARIADGHRAGLADGAALVEGLASTGRVVTFAAAIMVLVFGAFGFGDFVLIKILGFALGVAVFLDATVIRTAVGPALIRLAGRWNWWPGVHRTPVPGTLFAPGSINSDADEESRLSEHHQEPPAAEHLDDQG
jgi:RND superfamily putative drug exporter